MSFGDKLVPILIVKAFTKIVAVYVKKNLVYRKADRNNMNEGFKGRS